MIVRHNAPRMAALGNMAGAGARSLFDKYENVEMRGFSAFAGDPGNNSLIVVAKLRLAYAAGGAVQNIFPLDWEDAIGKALSYNWAMPLMGQSVVGSYFAKALESPGKAALAKNYKDLGLLIDDLADRKRKWAAAGKRDDGSPYSWQQWGQLAEVYLNSIVYYSKMPVTDGLIVNAALSIKDFFEDLRKVLTPSEWPLWAKIAAGLVGLAAVSYIIRTPAAVK